ncbi:hypothetical protein [Halorhabdus sp. BNX81]|uniref:hypothetical protein n=1 Tax=Halorhabdus sp. BNX81 TaxID=2980181 RepID=UPI0023DD2AF1|nr:hypothetical protein [Halorhabdus sp. BNX81]
MTMDSLRADGWEDVVAFFVSVIAAVVSWYTHGFYLNWGVFVVGIGTGIVVYFIFDFVEDRPVVVEFPITMALILGMLIALYEETLVAGVVAAVAMTTAIKAYDVYL